MRIIVWGINYAPELTGIGPFNTGLCEHLADCGHQVEMVTTFPYYPFWKKIPDDHGRVYRTDVIDRVWVHRCWQYVPARATTVRRMGHELSFAITSFVRVLFLARADLYVVVSPPLALGPMASLAARLKRRRYIFHVQDLQPDAAVGLGMVKKGRLIELLYRIEDWAYRDAAIVSGISGGMIEAFKSKGVPEAKTLLFPNWIRWFARNAEYRPPVGGRDAESLSWRKKFGISADAFLASYSGNLGRKQGLDCVVSAAAILEQQSREAAMRSATQGAWREIVILLVGDGANRPELEAQIAALGVKSSVRLLPLLLERDYRQMLISSDICLVTQAPGTGRYFFPSKLLSILSVGTPILSVADEDSELARAVEEGQFGINVAPGNPPGLAAQLRDLSEDSAPLDRMRVNTAWVQKFSASRVLVAFEKKLHEIVS